MIVKISLRINDNILPFELLVESYDGSNHDKEVIINKAIDTINSKFNLQGKFKLNINEVQSIEVETN